MKKNKYNSAVDKKLVAPDLRPVPTDGRMHSPAFNRVKQQVGPNTIPQKYDEEESMPTAFRSNPVRNAMGTAQKQAPKISGTRANWSKNKMTSAGAKNLVKVKGMP